MNHDDNNTIDALAYECGVFAASEGCTPDYLEKGWDLAAGDFDFIRDQIGRDMTPEEYHSARSAFERAIREQDAERVQKYILSALATAPDETAQAWQLHDDIAAPNTSIDAALRALVDTRKVCAHLDNADRPAHLRSYTLAHNPCNYQTCEYCGRSYIDECDCDVAVDDALSNEVSTLAKQHEIVDERCPLCGYVTVVLDGRVVCSNCDTAPLTRREKAVQSIKASLALNCDQACSLRVDTPAPYSGVLLESTTAQIVAARLAHLGVLYELARENDSLAHILATTMPAITD